jgi:hypothetical protein
LVLLPGALAEAQDACANGAVNLVTGNYGLGAGAAVTDDDGLATECEICVAVSVQVVNGANGGWEQVATICGLRTDAQAHDVMFRIGQCGLIVPAFETSGQFFGAAVPIRAEAARQQSCR